MTPAKIAGLAADAANHILSDLAAVPPRFSATTRAMLKSLAARLRVLSLASSSDLCASKEILYLLGSAACITPIVAEKAIHNDLRASPPSFSTTVENILKSIAARLELLSQSKDERDSREILYLLNRSVAFSPEFLDRAVALRPDFGETVEIEEQEHPSDDDRPGSK